MRNQKEKNNPNWRGGKYLLCDNCGKKRWYQPLQIKKNKFYHFCSWECYLEYRKKYPKKMTFNKIKNHVFETRHCVCGCGKIFTCNKKSKKRYIAGHNLRKYTKNNKRERLERLAKANKERVGKTFREIYGKQKGDNIQKRIAQKNIENSKKRIGKTFNELYGQSRGDVIRQQMSNSTKKFWDNKNKKEKENILRKILKSANSKPNNFEKNGFSIINKLFPNEYKLNVEGKTIIDFKIPDIINVSGYKKIIELFGDYWHSIKITGRTKEQEEQQRINAFKKYGYSTLIIWESELKNIESVKQKIIGFHLTKGGCDE